MTSLVKHTLAKVIARTRPTLFYYRASAAARRDLRVRKIGVTLEVIHDKRKQIVRINSGNAVHLPDMVDSFDYYFESTESVPIRYKGDVYNLVDFSTPRLHNVRGFSDFSVMCPSSTEPYTTTQQYLHFAQIGPGSDVIDLGAYSGLTSIAFSNEVGPTGRVIALEPDPLNFRAAEYNVEMQRRVNGLDNITLCAMAVADKDGVLELSSEGTMGSALTSIVGGYRGTTVKVEARSLLSLVRQFDLKKVDFVKIDVEGAELFVVPGSGEFLTKYRPRLIIECHMVDGVSTVDPVVKFLQGIGYQTRIEGQEGLTFSLIMAWID